MSKVIEQAKQVQVAAGEAVRGIDGLVQNPMLKMMPGSEKLPQVVELLNQAAGVLLVLAEEVEKLKGVENGEK